MKHKSEICRYLPTSSQGVKTQKNNIDENIEFVLILINSYYKVTKTETNYMFRLQMNFLQALLENNWKRCLRDAHACGKMDKYLPKSTVGFISCRPLLPAGNLYIIILLLLLQWGESVSLELGL
jgi:hypothetical protein